MEKKSQDGAVAVSVGSADQPLEGVMSDVPTPVQTKRGLSSRHVQLMAIAGAIGIGMFVGIGKSLSRAGPINLILGYVIFGLGFVWPLSLYIGEMVAWLPVRGSIFELATRFVDPSLGFAMGWVYFFSSVMLVCTEYSAVATVIQYWNTDISPAVWITLAITTCMFLNLVAVKWYGESEFVFGSTKVLLLVGLILMTFITMVGGNPNRDAYGFRNWTNGQAMHPYYAEGTTGRFLGFFICLRYAVFTVGGPDIITLSAGEIQNPRRTIPRVAKLIVWRIAGFYILGVIAVGIICPSKAPALLAAIKASEPGAGSSPWVVGINMLGINGFLSDLINFLIMLSGWSCGNAYLYSSSRTLYSLAQKGQAPKIFLKCTKVGIPWVCVCCVSLITCITYLVVSNSALTVFEWFLDLTTCGLIVNQTAMFAVFIGWYRALKAQGLSRDSLPYKAPLAPYTAWFGLVFGFLITFFIGFDVFVPFEVRGFVTSYFGLFWGIFMFGLWKILKRTKFVDPKHADIWGGKADIDEDCKIWEEGGIEENEKKRLAEMTFLRRTWSKMW